MFRIAMVSASVVAISALLIAWHVVEWRGLRDNDDVDDRERQFAWRRFRRRLQASGIVGLVGALLFASQWIASPVTAVVYWFSVLFLLLWMMVLAIGDAISSRNFLQAENRRQIAEQLRFQSEVLKRSRDELAAAEGGESSE